MAKWGEGDPRWIVEERADATNVNNWHWTEKNATPWSKDKLKSLLVGIKVEDDDVSCEVTELSKCEGEASANNRKAKLIFFYEWDIKLAWKGKLLDRKTLYEGTVVVPNLSDENDSDDLDIQVTTKNDKDGSHKVKEVMRIQGSKVIREQLAKYMTDLKIEFSQGMILPSKNDVANLKISATNTSLQTTKKASNSVSKNVSNPVSFGVKISTKTVTDKIEFKCEGKDLYRVFTDINMIQAFMRGTCREFSAEKGGRFVYLDGNVSGEFVQLTPYSKIVKRWRFKSWPEDHYSQVTLDIQEQDDCTKLVLTQTGVPENELDRTKEGWKNYFFDPIMFTFGYGFKL